MFFGRVIEVFLFVEGCGLSWGLSLWTAVADALQMVCSEALYESFGLRRKEIATLFAVGYGSSLSLGTIIAASADYM